VESPHIGCIIAAVECPRINVNTDWRKHYELRNCRIRKTGGKLGTDGTYPDSLAELVNVPSVPIFTQIHPGIFMGQRTSCTHSVSNHPYDDTCAFAPLAEAERRARAIVMAATHFNDPKVLLEVSEDVPSSMKGLAVSAMDEAQMLQTRGW
jgi:hypothetical protein